jgi:RsmE family RNA methyltransferase
MMLSRILPAVGATLVIADRDGLSLEAVAAAGRSVIALVGPEGGFTVEELATVEAAGGRRVSLGPHVLRIETAAVALAARLA